MLDQRVRVEAEPVGIDDLLEHLGVELLGRLAVLLDLRVDAEPHRLPRPPRMWPELRAPDRALSNVLYGIGASSVIADGTCLGLRVASAYTPTPIRPKKPHTSTAITWLRMRSKPQSRSACDDGDAEHLPA